MNTISAKSTKHAIQYHLPLVGDIHAKSPLAYQATRGIVAVANATQMALAEAYINGVEVPDSLVRSFFDTCMPPICKHFPALMTPYEWVLTETDHIAEGSR